MLNAYLAATQNLLQNPAAPSPLYSTANLTTYINTARGQLAGESGCIRFSATLAIVSGTQAYSYSSFNLTGAVGVQGALNVRTVWYQGGSGLVWVTPISFEEFSLYQVQTAGIAAGPPAYWAQYNPGANGTLYFSPTPTANYSANVDCVCYPDALASDSDPEAIPYLWTDAVPYFAAYLALLSAQTGVRAAEADKMLERYNLFVERARMAATSGVLPWQLPQQPVPGGINQPQQQPTARAG